VVGEREQGTLEPLLIAYRVVGVVLAAAARFAQQLGTLASLPPLVVLVLMSLNVIAASTSLAIDLAAGLLAFDLLAWRVVATVFDRERLVTGRRT